MPANLPPNAAATSAVRPAAWWRPTLSLDQLAVLVCVYLAVAANRPLWNAVLDGREGADTATWAFALRLFVLLAGVHLLILAPVLTRWTGRWLLAVVVVVAAVASYYVGTYGVVLDPAMFRNVLHTEPKEALDLIGPRLALHLLLVAAPPLVLLAWVRVRRDRLPVAMMRRAAVVGLAVLLCGTALLTGFQEFAGLMRNRKELRYLATPANVVYGLARAGVQDARRGPRTRLVVAPDATLGPAWSFRARPVLLVVVVGETARAANWGLGGYPRDTTPELAALAKSGIDLVNFSRVSSCGTDTETSVPCMFSAVGRRQYDEARIRGSESLLHVLARAGFDVRWRDNQTGCKGVCDGLPYEQIDDGRRAGCQPGRCLDAHLLDDLDAMIDGATASRQVVVLHQLGNHGPAYFARHDAARRVFEPTCDTPELARCPVDAIRNSYDNALRYTDHMLAQTIALLSRRAATHDTALLYVSDHGESLGEHGLFLHGVPYAIAPAVQTRVPMLLWTSSGFRRSMQIDGTCLRAQAERPLSHDNLFHTVLGLLDVETAAQEPDLDLTDGCRVDRLSRRPPVVPVEAGVRGRPA